MKYARNFLAFPRVIPVMQLLRSVLAAMFVVLVGVFTAFVIAVSAVVVFIASRWRSLRPGRGGGARTSGTRNRSPDARDEVIDVEATDVTTPAR